MANDELLRSGEQTGAKDLAWQAGRVVLRFEAYKQAEPPLDIYEEIYKRLFLWGDERIVDVGAHDGGFIFWLKSKGHKGDLIGIEPERSVLPKLHRQGRVRFFENFAQGLFGADHTVDVLTANFMMYFVPKEEQEAVLAEFKRVLKPDGNLVLSTSGAGNKAKHRLFEQRIGEYLGTVPPARMNASFDSQIATAKLRRGFANVLHCSYRGKMIFRDHQEAQAYYGSLLSMKEFFHPAITEQQLKEAYLQAVMPAIEWEIAELGQFEDDIERDFYICNDQPYGMATKDPSTSKIKRIDGYVLENIGSS